MKPPASAPMPRERWEAFRAGAVQELRQKQRRLTTEHGIGTYSRWWFEQETGTLKFYDRADRLGLEADFIDIGSYAPRAGTWQWAWSNDSVAPEQRKASCRLREIRALTGMAIIDREEPFEIDEVQAWELAALAVMHLGALGCYRAPTSENGLLMFLALMAIRSAN